MKRTTITMTLGNLIAALYEEAATLTSNEALQTRLVYLTLIDLQHSRSERLCKKSRRAADQNVA